MITNLTNQRGIEILQSLESHELSNVDNLELEQLESLGYVHHRKIETSISHIQAEIEQFKEQYKEKSDEFEYLKQEFMKKTRRINNTSFFSELFSNFHIGKKTRLLQDKKMLQKQISFKEKEIFTLKTQILDRICARDGDFSAYAVQNQGYRITPVGETNINEIKFRPRFLSKDCSELKEHLNQIDTNFRKQIVLIQKYISHRKFTPVLLPYIAHINQFDLIRKFDYISQSYDPYYSAEIPEKKMIDLLITSSYSSNYLPANYAYSALADQIKMIFKGIGDISPELDLGIKFMAKILILWVNFTDRDFTQQLFYHPYIKGYIENLTNLINEFKNPESDPEKKTVYSALNYGKHSSYHDKMALLLLALANEPLKFNYFYPKVNHGSQGGKFFATVLTLLPWSAEESWIMLKRAENHILMAQSVQFIPELLEYGIMLNLNPDLLTYIGGVEEDFLHFWKNVIIPSVAMVNVFSLDVEISNYVNSRPLAYITNPRPYYYHYGYYHRHYWFGWRRHRHYYLAPHRNRHSAYMRNTYKRGYVFNHRSSIRTGATSYRRGTTTRGTRYSSLHHHTIG